MERRIVHQHQEAIKYDVYNPVRPTLSDSSSPQLYTIKEITPLPYELFYDSLEERAQMGEKSEVFVILFACERKGCQT